MRPETRDLNIGQTEPLLRVLPEDDLVSIQDEARELARRLHDAGRVDAAWYVLVHLGASVEYEARRRTDLLDHARVEVEASGHEVCLWHGPSGWTSNCSCGWAGDEDVPEHVARSAGLEHAARHGSAWGIVESR
jgi:hypothetical protein